MSGLSPYVNIKLVFLFFAANCLALYSGAQNEHEKNEIQDYILNNIPVENQNWEIYRSPVNGYIYFANSAGLVEYNGITSRRYNLPYRQGIRSVYINDAGLIFTGSFEDFGFWEYDEDDNLKYHSLTAGVNVQKNDEIWNIYELDDVLFFQSFTTIYRLDKSGVTTIEAPSIMLFMFRVGEKFIVQALGNGLYWFDGSEFIFIEGSDLFRSMKVHAVIDLHFDNYWICTANNGIYGFNGREFMPAESEISDFLKIETCNAGIQVNDSLIAFGTILKGVVICDQEGAIQKTYDYANGLNNNTVLSFYNIPEKGFWVGLDEGANFISVDSPVTSYSNFSGSLGTIYTAIRKDNKLFLGTNHGLFVSDITIKRGDYGFTNLSIMPNTQGQVWQLSQFDGQILCGHNDGTYLLDEGQLRRISGVTGGWSLERYSDMLLQGTYTGIISFRKDETGKWQFRNRIYGYNEPTRFIRVDYLGYVWAVHPQKGIYRLELNETVDTVANMMYFSSIADTSNRITMSKINNQVVFMTSEYIYSFDYDQKAFFPVNSLEPGLGDYIRSTQIIHYSKNSYWFILGNRIALFDISRDLEATKRLEFFHRYADLPGREQQIIPLDNSNLLIPTRQAFATFNLERLETGDDESPVRITGLIFSDRQNTSHYSFKEDNVVVPNRINNLTVYIADPYNCDREDKEYIYRLTELGDEWYRTTLDNFSFLNLSFGTYHLQVKSVTGDKIAEKVFTVRRPNYLSLVALFIYVVILGLLVLAGIKIFRHELERHRKLIEYEVGKSKLESELDYKSYELMLTMRYLIRKTDILRELHDKLETMKAFSSKFPVKYIREMERIIDHGLDSQTEEWQNVMKNLKLSQEGFFRKLKDKYPALTPNDLRLCSYLRMNFTTKEIANLSNISSRAVEIGRYRLRRKMGLDHDINLTEFLIKEAESL